MTRLSRCACTRQIWCIILPPLALHCRILTSDGTTVFWGGVTLQAFDYIKATSEVEVVSLLCRDSDQTRILSGGTDLLVQLREGRRQAQLLVDIKQVPEANELAYDPV